MQKVKNALGVSQQEPSQTNQAGDGVREAASNPETGTAVTQAGPQSQQAVTSKSASGATSLSDTPILGGDGAAQMASQPPTTTTAGVQSQETPAQGVPVTETAPAKLASKNNSNGMPQDYSARTVKNPDDISTKHAGNMGDFRNIGTHKNEGIGTNTGPDYTGNTSASGVTDKTGQPLQGTPMVGTDGDMIGGSTKQSEKGRTKGLYDHAF
ncbi:hypothetical protein ABBQ38_012131 [Trebouxia sp. C0009 RCD-2024]